MTSPDQKRHGSRNGAGAERLRGEGASSVYAERLAHLAALSKRIPQERLYTDQDRLMRRVSLGDALRRAGREGCITIVEAYLAGASIATIAASSGFAVRDVWLVLRYLLPMAALGEGHRYDRTPPALRMRRFAAIWEARRQVVMEIFAPGGVLPERMPCVYLLTPPAPKQLKRLLANRVGVISSWPLYDALSRALDECGAPAVFLVEPEPGTQRVLSAREALEMRRQEMWELDKAAGLPEQKYRKRYRITTDPVRALECAPEEPDCDVDIP